jgi:F-type H+-transporting ATPase subunit gamma
MKFVAAAKLRRAQENMMAARPYTRQMTSLLASAMSRLENPEHPLLAKRPEERVLALVFTGDKGLCGAFNTNVLRRANEFVKEYVNRKLRVIAVGKKGRDSLRKRKVEFAGEYVNIFARVKFEKAKEISKHVIEQYAAGEADAVYVIFNEFKSVLTQRLVVQKVLPIDASEFAGAKADPQAIAGTQVDYIYDEPAAEMLGKLLPRYVETQVYRAILETNAAFNAAQMTAMDSATKNASELIDRLTLHMNKVRQAAITKEIIEVVSGAAAAQ